jgi:hypothetical protein
MSQPSQLSLFEHYTILEERIRYIRDWEKANRRLMRRIRDNFALPRITLHTPPRLKH